MRCLENICIEIIKECHVGSALLIVQQASQNLHLKPKWCERGSLLVYQLLSELKMPEIGGGGGVDFKCTNFLFY